MIIRKSIPAAFSTDPTSVTSRLLGSRPLHFLGVISYTIYMTHLVILNVFTFSFGTPDKWPLSTYVLLAATTCVVFVGTYFGLEVPARSAIRNLQRRRLARDAS
jgi:peptidoglycan/LPS O-acetylase OafA/YrhL